MEKMIWDDSYRIGITTIDRQHQTLFSLYNKLVDAHTNNGHDEIVTDALTEMTEYYKHHFETEEQYMEGFEFPLLKEHQKEHEHFIEDTIQLCFTAMQNNDQVVTDLFETLSSWLKNHILGSDMQLKSYLKEKGIQE